MPHEAPAILWLRQDLRLEDNPALTSAATHPLICLYIWDEKDPWPPGGASKWWLHKSLESLKKSLNERGVSLILKRGNPLEVLKKVTQATNTCALYWNRCYEPYATACDQEIKAHFKNTPVHSESFKGSLLAEPWDIQTKSGKPYQVFTPFWRALQKVPPQKPLPIPDLHGWTGSLSSDFLEDWDFNPTLWGKGLEATWTPGEEGAHERLTSFLKNRLDEYEVQRDFPALDATSHLSPHLHWGEISPSQVWHHAMLTHGPSALPFLRQLGWREFSYHLLFHFPHMPTAPLKSSFKNFPWESDGATLQAWQKGQTGYPFVDAGMRELWETGVMHNRSRMVVASFLVKHLLLPWQKGEEWFWDTLVDADLANNAASWQWVAGCGADAAPFFRIFNPILQSQKFDPEGIYIKKWVPELRGLSTPHIHAPWQAPKELLEQAGIQLGKTYPLPIIDHGFARTRALAAFRSLRG